MVAAGKAVRELFRDDAIVRRMTTSIAANLDRAGKASRASASMSTKSVAAIERRIRNLTEALAAAPASRALVDKLKDEERQLAEDRAAARAPGSTHSAKPPSEEQVRGYLAGLVNTLQADPVAGRHLLAEVLSPVTLTPTEKPRGFQCRAVFRLPSGLSSPGRRAEVLEKCSSGGRSLPLAATIPHLVEFGVGRAA